MKREISLVRIGHNERIGEALKEALFELPVTEFGPDYIVKDGTNRLILFTLALDELGAPLEFYQLLRDIRQCGDCFEGSLVGMVVDGNSELFTKNLAQELALAVNMAGGALPGKPLVEGTGSLYNHHIKARLLDLNYYQTYVAQIRALGERLLDFYLPVYDNPRILMLHASDNKRSNTLWMGRQVLSHLPDQFSKREISLQNGTIHDCRGCSFEACLHFAQNDTCFYGGPMSEEVLPAILESDVLLCLCPNYNDSVSANMMAMFNRLTSLLTQNDLYYKYVYAVVVSGYSGSDLVARQVLGSMCMNKTAILPPKFALMKTAHDPDSARKAEGIEDEIQAFAANIRKTVLGI
ncbi:MAG: NAD(P)H-dependent oxidoreductase [Lachnospiraceae bacterium]|nr:NAD(P)H-dependent oxidoreductase [Candidatus Equihabitans merdae]